MKNKILVVAAHPDDELLGVGGTIIRHILSGDEVSVLILADGETSRPGAAAKEIKRRLRQIKEVARKLKLKKLFIKNLPDQKLDTLPLLEIIQIVEGVIRAVSPNIIYTHHSYDLNSDHRITFQAVLTACRPRANFCVKELLAFETPSSTEWQIKDEASIFRPTRYVNIEKVFKKKIKAIKIYQDELREYPHPRSAAALENLAKFRGLEVGLKYAEAFQVIRAIE
jgi:LmbE family N-acetylglucosaminyl deacetylase